MIFAQILTDIQTQYTPLLNKRILKRRLNYAKHQARKTIRVNIRKVRSRSIAVWRRQYFVTSAYSDMKLAIKSNEDIFIAAIIIALALGFSTLALFSNALYLFLSSVYEISDAVGLNIALFAVAACGVITVLSGWVVVFISNMLSFSIMEGAVRKQQRSMRQTIRKSLRYTSRVTLAWFLLAAAIAAPILLTAIASYLYLVFGTVSQLQMLSMAPFAIVAALTGVILVLMQYSLVPYVALFESRLGWRDTFARSRKLVFRRGRIFILLGYSILAATLYGIYALSVLIDKVLGLQWLVFSIGSLTTIVLANGIMVMLYRKRRLARKY